MRNRANFTLPRYLVFFLLSRAGIIDWQTQLDTRTYPDAACFSTATSDHHRAKMDNNSSDGRGDGVECTRQAGFPEAGEGRMPGMHEFSGISATSSAAPAGLLCDGVAPNACPQLGTRFNLPGKKRVAVGAPDARWGGGNTWQPLHFSAIADAMGSGLGSTHVDILSCLRNLDYTSKHCCCCCCCKLTTRRTSSDTPNPTSNA